MIKRLASIVSLLALASAGASAVSAASLPPLEGERSQFVELDPRRPAPPLIFLDRDGNKRALGESYGKVRLINIWATWCMPCYRELPALDRLQRDFGSGLEVIALSLDHAGPRDVVPLFREKGIDNLEIYLDPTQATVQTKGEPNNGLSLPLYTVPMTYAVDEQGRLLGYLMGLADWDAPGPRRFVNFLVGRAQSASASGSGGFRDRLDSAR